MRVLNGVNTVYMHYVLDKLCIKVRIFTNLNAQFDGFNCGCGFKYSVSNSLHCMSTSVGDYQG